MTDGNDQAYPLPDVTGLPNGHVSYGCRGMTKRELFAAMAMQGAIAQCAFEDVATVAVELADALIAELNKEQTT